MTDAKKIKTTTLRLPEDLFNMVTKAADKSDRSFNSFVLWSLRNEIKRSTWLDDANETGSKDHGK